MRSIATQVDTSPSHDICCGHLFAHKIIVLSETGRAEEDIPEAAGHASGPSVLFCFSPLSDVTVRVMFGFNDYMWVRNCSAFMCACSLHKWQFIIAIQLMHAHMDIVCVPS